MSLPSSGFWRLPRSWAFFRLHSPQPSISFCAFFASRICSASAGESSPLLRIHVPTWMIQDNLPIPRFLTLTTSAKPLLPRSQGNLFTGSGIRGWTSLEVSIPPTTGGKGDTFNYHRSISFAPPPQIIHHYHISYPSKPSWPLLTSFLPVWRSSP